MPFVTPNRLLDDLKGKFGDMYIAKYGKQYRLKRCPARKRRAATAAQEPVRLKLMDANAYWKGVQARLEAKAVYDLAGKLRGQRGCDLAKADFSYPPTVGNIDLSRYIGNVPGTIRIKAADDFEVIKVSVRILALDGTLIEEGDAALDVDGAGWSYLSKVAVGAGTAVVIEAKAADRPGHTGVKKVDHVCGPRM
jgi:hypothetical protein